MAFKRNVLLVFLAAGLFLSPLSGCNGDKSSSGTEVVKPAEIIEDEQEKALEELENVETALGELNTYTEGIDPNGILNYPDAKAKVDAVYTAYKQFRESLSEKTKGQISFSAVDTQVEQLFKEDSEYQKILANLVDGDKISGTNDEYKAAQEGLQSLKLTEDTPTGRDGYATKFATQELLKKIVNETRSALNSLRTSINNLSNDTPPISTATADKKNITDTWLWSDLLLLVISLSLVVVVVGIIIFYILPKRRKKSSSQQKKKSFPWFPLFSRFDDITEIKEQLDNISGNIVPEVKLVALLEEERNSQTNHVDQKIEQVVSSQDTIRQIVASNRPEPVNLDEITDYIKQILTIVQQIPTSDSSATTDLQNQISEQGKTIEALTQERDKSQQQVQQLEQQVQQLSKYLSQATHNISALQGEIARLKQDKEQSRQAATKEPPQTGDIPSQWLTLVNTYNKDTKAVLKSDGVTPQGEFLEDEKQERLGDSTKPVIFKSVGSGDYYIVSLGAEYLLFPKYNVIPQGQKFTASGSFEGYEPGKTKKFTLETPGKVVPWNNGMWKLERKGKLHYNDTPYRETPEQEKEEYKKAAAKKPPQPSPSTLTTWLTLISIYQQDSRAILQHANLEAETLEDEEQFFLRRKNPKEPLMLKSTKPGQYLVVSLQTETEPTYLLFPKEHAIPASQASTAKALFAEYEKGNTSKFTLIIPAQVSPTEQDKWKLEEKGRLEYKAT